LNRQVSHEQHDADLDNCIRRLLVFTGPVEPSAEFVGYF
jgi:hypothetical protein